MSHSDEITIEHYIPETAEYAIRRFGSEFFVCAGGVKGEETQELAMLAAETALWGYREIRTRACYWKNKKILIERILRTTNTCIWQKKKRGVDRSGVLSECTVGIIGVRSMWIGYVGDVQILERRGDGERRILDKHDNGGKVSRSQLGQERYVRKFSVISLPFDGKDTVVIVQGKNTNLGIRELDGICSLETQERNTLADASQNAIILIHSAQQPTSV